MQRIRLDQDIRTLSEFKANASALIREVQENRTPLVITQKGKSAAIMLNIYEYEKIQERLELLEDICLAKQQLAEGKGIDHEDAEAYILGNIGK